MIYSCRMRAFGAVGACNHLPCMPTLKQHSRPQHHQQAGSYWGRESTLRTTQDYSARLVPVWCSLCGRRVVLSVCVELHPRACPIASLSLTIPCSLLVTLAGTEFLGLKIDAVDLGVELGKPFSLTLQVWLNADRKRARSATTAVV